MKRVVLFAIALAAVRAVSSPAQAADPAGRYAVLVGIQAYEHADLRTPPLKYPVSDVTELERLLRPAGYKTALLTDESGKANAELRPTKENIMAAIRAAKRKCPGGGTLLLALAGHGIQFAGETDAYFCPIDARPFAREKESLVSIKSIYDEMESSFAGAKIMLIDACRNDPDPGRGRDALTADAIPPPRGVGVIFSCSPGQRAFEHDSLKHGVFFYYVLESLRSAGPKGVNFYQLLNDVNTNVPARTGELLPGREQLPNLQGNVFGAPVLIPPAAAAARPKGGTLDTTFGADGTIVCDFFQGGRHGCYSVAVQPDGKVVIAGEAEKHAGANTYLLSVARFNPDGRPDTTFAGLGRRLYNFGPYDDGCRGRNLLLQPDGKMVVGGRTEVSAYGYEFGVVRFNSDGSLDASFNGTGFATTIVTSTRSADISVMKLQPDGKILAAGLVNAGATVGNANAVGLARFQTDGRLDPAFSGDGKVVTNFQGDTEYVADMAVRDDGKSLVVGSTEGAGGRDMFILRYNPNGLPDASFNGTGYKLIDFQGNHDSLAGVVAQGTKTVVGGVSSGAPMLIRLNNDGSFDRSFGPDGNGRVRIPFSPSSMCKLPDGRIVISGSNDGPVKVGLYSADGKIQSDFGDQGVAAHKLSDADVARDVTAAPDGRILVAGEIPNARGTADCLIMRFTAP